MDYIDANRQQVEDQYARIEERIRQGNPEKLGQQLCPVFELYGLTRLW
jgi:hypothetical protein